MTGRKIQNSVQADLYVASFLESVMKKMEKL